MMRVGTNRKCGGGGVRIAALLLVLLAWIPAISQAVTVRKFVAAQQYGLNVRGFYYIYNMDPSGAVSGGSGTPEIHVFPYSADHINSYNSIFEKYVVMGWEVSAGGTGAYDPINDPSITGSFQLGPKVPLGFTTSGQSAFFRLINVLQAPEITVRTSTSQNLLTGGTATFPTTEVGSDKTVTFQIVNTGNMPLTGIAVSIAEQQQFMITQQAAATLAAGASTTFSIKFRPTGTGVRTGFLRIASNDADENPFNLGLSGSATGVVNRSIQIMDSSYHPLANGSGVENFGNTTVPSTISKTLAITNNGNVPLSNIAVSLSGTHASDFSVTALPANTLETGAIMPLQISFTPTAHGSRQATITVASNATTNNPYVFQITGSASGAVTFDFWVQGTTLVGANAEPAAMPFGDGVPNLLKYAFNLNPNGPDSRRLQPGAGTAGLPLITMEQPGSDVAVRIEFLRRKNSGLVYTPKRSSTLSPGSFTAIIGPLPVVTGINDEWERVVINFTQAPGTMPAGFYHVQVTKP